MRPLRFLSIAWLILGLGCGALPSSIPEGGKSDAADGSSAEPSDAGGDASTPPGPSDASTPDPVFDAGSDLGPAAIELGAAYSCHRQGDAGLRCWGLNDEGELADGTTTERHSPVVSASGIGPVRQLAAGGLHACARVADSTVRCWGDNRVGQLGDGTQLKIGRAHV